MISAKEAYEKTISLKESNDKRILEEIETEITEAISNGMFEIVAYGHLPDSVVQKLESLDYSVHRYSEQREGNWSTINWGGCDS